MILASILLIMLVLLAVTAIAIISVGGTAFIIIFGDIIVCMALIIWILVRLFRKK